MPLEVCRCCAGKMTVSSPRNPNICVSCEQLLEDDCMKLDALLSSMDGAGEEPPAEYPPQDSTFEELHEMFASSV